MPLDEDLRNKIKISTELIQELEDQIFRYQFLLSLASNRSLENYSLKNQFLLSLASGRSLENYSLKISQINKQLTAKQEALKIAIQQLEDLVG